MQNAYITLTDKLTGNFLRAKTPFKRHSVWAFTIEIAPFIVKNEWQSSKKKIKILAQN
jgi:hypothetical protein